MIVSSLKSKLSHYKDIIYNKYYPPTILNRRKLQRRLENKNFSLLTGNCVGGYIYHQLGLTFSSPTINMMILNQDFKKLILNLEHYLKLIPEPCVDPNFPGVPCASLDDIILHFTHYKSSEEGINAWEKRKQRLDLKNLYIIISDIDLSEDDIKELQYANCKKIIVMTSKDYGYDHCLYIPAFKGMEHVGELLSKTWGGKWKFEEYFDFVNWVNTDKKVAQHFYIGK